MENFTTRELTKSEADALTKDLQEVLKKHNCEMGVVSSIQLLKRVELPEEGIPTPYMESNGENNNKTKEKPDSETEEGSDQGSGKPA